MATRIYGSRSEVSSLVFRTSTDNEAVTLVPPASITPAGMTFTLPDAAASDTLVSLTSTATLTNKTLTSPTFSTIENGGTLTLPSGADTLIGRASTDTLTNKSIDADTNTVTNIENADIKAAAAIDTTKLAALTVSRALVSNGSGFLATSATTSTQVGYLSGLTSDVQVQLNAKGNTALSDLASVAINTSLISDTDDTDDLGSSAIGWANAYLNNIHVDSNGFTTSLQGSGSASESLTYTLPPAGPSVDGQILTGTTAGVMTWTSTASGDVTAASVFGTDNTLIRADGTGKGVQSSGITIDDSDNINTPGKIGIGANPTSEIAALLVTTDATVPASVSNGADEIVISNNGAAGMTLYSPAAAGTIAFRDAAGEPGSIIYDHVTDDLTIMADDDVVFTTASTERWRIDVSGNLSNSNGGELLNASGTIGSPAYSFASDTNTGISNPAADTLVFVTNATERLRIDSSGRVGIGSDPDAQVPGVLINSGDVSVGAISDCADDLAIINAGDSGLTLKSGDAAEGCIYFGDVTAPDSGKISYDHATDNMTVVAADDVIVDTGTNFSVDTNNVNRMTVNSSGITVETFAVLSSSTATIASGILAVTSSRVIVSGQGGAADNLDTINGGVDGSILVLQRGTGAITVTEADNLKLNGGSFVMNSNTDTMMLMRNGTVWLELSRSDNA